MKLAVVAFSKPSAATDSETVNATGKFLTVTSETEAIEKSIRTTSSPPIAISPAVGPLEVIVTSPPSRAE